MSALDEQPTHPHLLHPHTGQPLRALGVRRNGAPIWPQLGGAPDDEDDTDGDTDADGDGEEGQEQDEDKPLGEPGVKALNAEKEKRRKATERARTAEQRATAAEAEVARLKAGKTGSDDDKPDPEEIRRTAREEAKAETLRERVLDKIEAKAAALFADPEDAVALLGRRPDEYIDGGKVDVDAIVEALDELLERKPHLGKAAGKQKRPAPDRSQGAGKGGNAGAGPTLDEQIAEAQKAGKHLELIRLQRQKLQPKSTK